MNYTNNIYSVVLEAVSVDEKTNEMVCKLNTGLHIAQVKIPLVQFEQLKKDGFFALRKSKMCTQTFIEAPGFVSDNTFSYETAVAK